jgi:hypothetical protein
MTNHTNHPDPDFVRATVQIVDGKPVIVRQPVECIVIPNVDGPTLWDCPCSECRSLRAHAAWMDDV